MEQTSLFLAMAYSQAGRRRAAAFHGLHSYLLIYSVQGFGVDGKGFRGVLN